MSLSEYFETTKGVGVLSTADSEGRVDAAIYARPHFADDGTMAFIMRDRLTHHNLQSNPYATYLFKEDGPGYHGKRLFMSKSATTSRVRDMRKASGMAPGHALLVVADL